MQFSIFDIHNKKIPPYERITHAHKQSTIHV